MLYASQWFLTVYSCPFPATFSCRVIDVMLTEHSPNILMRAALAVLAECEEDLLQLHDFEDLITYLKARLNLWIMPQTCVQCTKDATFLEYQTQLSSSQCSCFETSISV